MYGKPNSFDIPLAKLLFWPLYLGPFMIQEGAPQIKILPESDFLNSWHQHSLLALDNHILSYDIFGCPFTIHRTSHLQIRL